MFRKGENEVIQLLLGFKFSLTTGLVVNPQKSSMYCCGIFDHQAKTFTDMSGFNMAVL